MTLVSRGDYSRILEKTFEQSMQVYRIIGDCGPPNGLNAEVYCIEEVFVRVAD